MGLGKKRTFRGNMKAAFIYLNGYCTKDEKKNHFNLFKEDKTRFNGEKL